MAKESLKRLVYTLLLIFLLGGALLIWKNSIIHRAAGQAITSEQLAKGYLPEGALTYMEKEVLQLLERPRRINLGNDDHVYAIRDWRKNGRILYFNQDGEIKDAGYLALILSKDPEYGGVPLMTSYWHKL